MLLGRQRVPIQPFRIGASSGSRVVATGGDVMQHLNVGGVGVAVLRDRCEYTQRNFHTGSLHGRSMARVHAQINRLYIWLRSVIVLVLTQNGPTNMRPPLCDL